MDQRPYFGFYCQSPLDRFTTTYAHDYKPRQPFLPTRAAKAASVANTMAASAAPAAAAAPAARPLSSVPPQFRDGIITEGSMAGLNPMMFYDIARQLEMNAEDRNATNRDVCGAGPKLYCSQAQAAPAGCMCRMAARPAVEVCDDGGQWGQWSALYLQGKFFQPPTHVRCPCCLRCACGLSYPMKCVPEEPAHPLPPPPPPPPAPDVCTCRTQAPLPPPAPDVCTCRTQPPLNTRLQTEYQSNFTECAPNRMHGAARSTARFSHLFLNPHQRIQGPYVRTHSH